MGDLFLCCNVWFRAWPSVRGKHQRVFRSLRSCFEKRAILGTDAEYLSMWLWQICCGLNCFNVMIRIYSVTAHLPRSCRTDGPWGEQSQIGVGPWHWRRAYSCRVVFVTSDIYKSAYCTLILVVCLITIVWGNTRIWSHFVDQNIT